MHLSIFGLTISSSWGNGHATLWRGLCRGLASGGHQVTFFERDVPYYAQHRDLRHWPYGELRLYGSWEQLLPLAWERLARSDAVIITSFCPDANPALDLAEAYPRLKKVFYDMDTPVTLQALARGEKVAYLPPDGLRRYDTVLSFTGGPVVNALIDQLGAREVHLLFGHADPMVHRPEAANAAYRSDLSYLGTFAADRQPALERLFVAPARQSAERKFLLAGSLYPPTFPWTPNIFFIPHLPPPEHPAFFSSSALTLNVTRRAMADNGYCPSGRLFEAAACGTPILSDVWDGLERFFVPGKEILFAETTEDVLAALSLPVERLQEIGEAGRKRVLKEHTSEARARDLEQVVFA